MGLSTDFSRARTATLYHSIDVRYRHHTEERVTHKFALLEQVFDDDAPSVPGATDYQYERFRHAAGYEWEVSWILHRSSTVVLYIFLVCQPFSRFDGASPRKKHPTSVLRCMKNVGTVKLAMDYRWTDYCVAGCCFGRLCLSDTQRLCESRQRHISLVIGLHCVIRIYTQF